MHAQLDDTAARTGNDEGQLAQRSFGRYSSSGVGVALEVLRLDADLGLANSFNINTTTATIASAAVDAAAQLLELVPMVGLDALPTGLDVGEVERLLRVSRRMVSTGAIVLVAVRTTLCLLCLFRGGRRRRRRRRRRGTLLLLDLFRAYGGLREAPYRA